jgi:hypothetical protein
MTETVHLLEPEMRLAATVGVRRMVSSLYRGSFDNNRTKRDDHWQNHIEAAAAELAFCRFMGIPWPATVDAWGQPDAGKLYEVRQTKCEDPPPHLYIRPKKDKHPLRLYTLVLGSLGKYTMLGWIRCVDATRQEWWRTDAWMVPCAKLSKDWERLKELERQG